MTDPTTAAIAEQIADRERLRAEIARLVDETVTLRRLLDAERAQCAKISKTLAETSAERDRLRVLVDEACGELVTIRVTAAERAAWKRTASGKPLAEWIREVCAARIAKTSS